MAKQHHSEAPPAVKNQLERRRLDNRLETASGAIFVASIGTLNWIRAAIARGYDVRPDEVPTPAHDQIAAFKGSPADLAALRVRLSLECQYERESKRLSESMRKWATEPSESELAEVRQAEREKHTHEAAIERRTQELLAAEETKRAEAARKKARTEAEREMSR